MMKKFLSKLFKKSSSNQNGSILAVTLVVMVVLAASVSAITQLTVNQLTLTTIKLETVNDENTAKRLIQQAIGEFETYIDNTNGDFSTYNSTEVPIVLSTYGVTVADVSGTGDFLDFNGVDSWVYRFSIPLDNGNILVMYSYISSSGSIVEQLDPFDFSLATNGSLVVNGGYLRDASLFGKDIFFGYVSPYIEKINGLPTSAATTPTGSGAYPDFNGNGSQSDVYFTNSYVYCLANCFDVGPTILDEFVLQKSEYLDIVDSGLETGTINGDKIISDFFGDFSINTAIVDFVKNEGPTGSRTITDAMTFENIGTVVLANSDVPEETCVTVKIQGKDTLVCTYGASTEPYTNVTSFVDFDPENEAETIDYGAVYNGDMIINETFEISNLETENFVVVGDLTFNNVGAIDLTGMFVVLGDLYFSGDTVAINGGFYVTGETFIEFNEGEGVESQGPSSEYAFSLLTNDNVYVNSMWESHTSSADNVSPQFDWIIYTDESIYIDAINSRLDVNGVFFAAARNQSGNYIFMEDEAGVPVHGIIINSYRGYINNSGAAVPSSQTSRNSFNFDVVNEGNLADAFIELPTFNTLVVSQGTYSFERSEFSLE